MQYFDLFAGDAGHPFVSEETARVRTDVIIAAMVRVHGTPCAVPRFSYDRALVDNIRFGGNSDS